MLMYLAKNVVKLLSSQLAQNIFSLTLVRGSVFFIPLITMPYVTRVLSPEEWGYVAWMQVILGYFSVLTDWGFSWSGTRKIAFIQNDYCALSEIFIAGWVVQWVLCLISIGILLILSFYLSIFLKFLNYIFFGSWVIIAGVLFPIWLFNGLERIREIAIIQFFTKVLTIPLIFIFVQSPGDGSMVIMSSAITGVLSGVLSIHWLLKHEVVQWKCPSFSSIWCEFLDSGSIFFSRIWIVIYTSLVPSILGIMVNAEAVGQFAVANKIRLALQAVLAPVSQALYPRMSYLFKNDRALAIRTLRRSSVFVILLSLIFSLALFVLAEYFVHFLAGDKFLDAIIILKWMSPLPFITTMSNIFGVQMMLPNLMTVIFNRILAIAGILSLITIWLWIWMLGVKGVAINILVIECFVTTSMFIYIVYNKKKFF